MTALMDKRTLSKLQAQIFADPLLPRDNPTIAFWQLPPHPLSEVRSEALPNATDCAIIGSGVTGCSIAKNLLEITSSGPLSLLSVTVLEARTLASGATGRNGGFLMSHVPGQYPLLSKHFGHKEAAKIARFANNTLDKMYELAHSSKGLQDASDVRKLLHVVCYQDEGLFQDMKDAWRIYEENVPEDKTKVEILRPKEAESKYNIKTKAGCIVSHAGAFWPYRLITNIWAQLYEQHRSRFAIETMTPVTDISYEPDADAVHPFVLHTSRGKFCASHVVHATNAYAGHLLPELRGKIYPLRGTVSAQKSTPEFGQHGLEFGWSIVGDGGTDSTTRLTDLGLRYSNQNPKTGDIFVGADRARIDEFLSSDDSQVTDPCVRNITAVLPKMFALGWKDGDVPEVRSVWTGIMGFTPDHLPMVGRLPQSVTKRGERPGSGEWISAGFNGFGMPFCWSCGELIARSLLGMDISDLLPESFLVTEQRLEDKKRMSVDPALAPFWGGIE